ncbi:hypothetical protein [Clostridium baratii]|uniref:hypothetical protein n=1 Tax=Clostridium baratii TaxID=1561 RepID=UPI00097FB12C|nr:hypothetical protein [Clostridium baratii]AQM61302.1 hypothetical protein NPD11_441 [Clostridium baratii]
MIDGQVSIFDLEEDEIIQIEFTKEQQDTIEKLKEKNWIEYSLYDNGMVIFILKEQVNINVIPQGNVEQEYKIRDNYKSYFIKENGEIDCYGLGITRWNDPIKVIEC